MERIRRAMHANETFAVFDRVEKCRFGFLAHRRMAIGADGCQVACRIKHERIKLLQVLRREDSAVFAEGEFDVVLRPKFFEHGFGKARAVRPFDGGMFKAR